METAFQAIEASKTPIQDLFKDDYKKSAGNNRHEDVLRVCDSLIARNADILPEEQIRQMAYIWNQEHCQPPLDEREFEILWKQAAKFIARNRAKQEGEEEICIFFW